MLVQNNQHGTLKAVAVRAPGFGHRRIAHLQRPGGVHRRRGDRRGGRADARSTSSPRRSGRARRVIVTRGRDGARRGRGHAPTAVEARLDQIRVELERADAGHRHRGARERLAKLASRLAVIHVGAATESRARWRSCGAPRARWRRRRAAVGEGIVAGRRDRAAARRAGARRPPASTATTCAAPRSSAACCPSRCTGSRPNAGYDGQAVVEQVRAMPAGHGLERAHRRVRRPVRATA